FQKPHPAANDQFGIWVVAMGNTLIIGAPGDSTAKSNAGAVYLFDATTYDPLPISPLRNPTPVEGELFGSSLAVAGTNVLVGAPGGSDQPGAAYLFDGATGKLLQPFQSPTPAAGDMFGFAMDAATDRLLIAAPGDHSGSNLGGATFLFK